MAFPEFERPPLNEVVIGLQFDALPLRLVHLGAYWLGVRSRYPVTEEKPPLAHLVELSEPQRGGSATLAVEIQPPIPRCWFLDEPGNNLIQIQPDRFLRNWRQLNGSEVYPRYHNLVRTFREEWSGFRKFLVDQGVGTPRVNQCELAYVNHFEPGIGWRDFAELDKLFSFMRQTKENAALPSTEILKLAMTYKLPDLGRFHVNVDTVFRGRDLKLILAMNLTVRGVPAEASDEGLSRWFDSAHVWIVRSFDELTTPAMHQIWGKKQ